MKKFIVVNNDYTIEVFNSFFAALRHAIETPGLMHRNVQEVIFETE